jgi:hypothetical protein
MIAFDCQLHCLSVLSAFSTPLNEFKYSVVVMLADSSPINTVLSVYANSPSHPDKILLADNSALLLKKPRYFKLFNMQDITQHTYKSK